MDPGVDVGHEGVEMHPPFRRLGHSVVEEVHQHRLAPPHVAHDVEALWSFIGFRAEEAPPGRHFVRAVPRRIGRARRGGSRHLPGLRRAADRLWPPGAVSGREPWSRRHPVVASCIALRGSCGRDHANVKRGPVMTAGPSPRLSAGFHRPAPGRGHVCPAKSLLEVDLDRACDGRHGNVVDRGRRTGPRGAVPTRRGPGTRDR